MQHQVPRQALWHNPPMVEHDPYTRPAPSAHRITILGGTGFVGGHLVHRLDAAGHRVNVLSRRREAHRELLVYPNVEVFTANVYDPEALARHFDNSDVVINLVGILNEKRHDGAGFRRAHVELTQIAADTARKMGVRRFLQMSALGAAPDASSQYQLTKYAAEDYLLTRIVPDLDVTIFRPSVIFGPGDSFLNRFARLLKLAPGVLPLACPDARFAPVYVNDVVEAFVRSLNDATTFGRRYSLCGPDVYTLREIVAWLQRQTRTHRLVVPLPDALAKVQAAVLEYFPGKPFSLDNYRSLSRDSVCDDNGLHAFGIRPTGMEAVVPAYLSSRRLRPDYERFPRRERR